MAYGPAQGLSLRRVALPLLFPIPALLTPITNRDTRLRLEEPAGYLAILSVVRDTIGRIKGRDMNTQVRVRF